MKKADVEVGKLYGYRQGNDHGLAVVLSVDERYASQHSPAGYPTVVVRAAGHKLTGPDPSLLDGITLEQFAIAKGDADGLPGGVKRAYLSTFAVLAPIDRELAERDFASATAKEIRAGLEGFVSTTVPKLILAYERNHWRILGYADWAAYVEAEYGEMVGLMNGLTSVMTELRASGMPTRAIAPVVRKSHETVRKVISTPAVDRDLVVEGP